MNPEATLALIGVVSIAMGGVVYVMKKLFQQNSDNTVAFTETLKAKIHVDGELSKSISRLSLSMDNGQAHDIERHELVMKQLGVLHRNSNEILKKADRNYKAINTKIDTQHVKNQIVENESVKNKRS